MMQTLIFRTFAPFLTVLMTLYSVFVLLRGHNDPGGGFIGGLIAASAVAIYGIACGVASVRRALYFPPSALAAFGLILAGCSGFVSAFFSVPYLTGLWAEISVFGVSIQLSTPLFFDIGVYFVVLGTMSAIALVLEEPARM